MRTDRPTTSFLNLFERWAPPQSTTLPRSPQRRPPRAVPRAPVPPGAPCSPSAARRTRRRPPQPPAGAGRAPPGSPPRLAAMGNPSVARTRSRCTRTRPQARRGRGHGVPVDRVVAHIARVHRCRRPACFRRSGVHTASPFSAQRARFVVLFRQAKYPNAPSSEAGAATRRLPYCTVCSSCTSTSLPPPPPLLCMLPPPETEHGVPFSAEREPTLLLSSYLEGSLDSLV